MNRSLTNRMWTLILLVSCLLLGTASGLVPAAMANGTSYSDGADGPSPGFVPPPGATGDPDWPVSPGSPAPSVGPERRGGRGDLIDPRAGRLNVRPTQVREVWMKRFQIMVRVWLAYYQR